MSDVKGVFTNLVENTYIHSNTDIFQDVINNRINLGLKRYEDKRIYSRLQLEEQRQELKNIIRRITDKCNLFYQDLGLLGRDQVLPDGMLQLDGARDFEKKFLIANDSTNNMLENNIGIINDIMVSLGYQREIEARLQRTVPDNQQSLFMMRNLINTAIDEGVVSEGQKSMLRDISINTAQVTIEQISPVIESIFVLGGGKTRKRGGSTLLDPQRKILERFLKVTHDDNFVKQIMKKIERNKSELQKLKNSLKREIAGNVYDVDVVTNTMYQVLLDELKNRKINITQIGTNSKFELYFKREMKKALQAIFSHRGDSSKISFQVGDSRLNGLIFEQSGAIVINAPSLLSQVTNNFPIAKVVGQTLTSSGKQSETDIEVIGNSGQTYKIQVKNSFSQNPEYDSIHLQSEIHVKSFAEKIFGAGTWEEKLFEYVILNRAFLSRAGLSFDKKTHLVYEKLLKIENNSHLYEMIQFFLDQCILQLLGNKIQSIIGRDSEIKMAKSQSQLSDIGNLFFLFRKQYLIPVSVFVLSAINCLNQILKMNDSNLSYNIGSAGRLVYKGDLDLPHDRSYTYTGNIAFRKRKFDALRRQYMFNNQFKKSANNEQNVDRYPSNLVRVGADMGQKMLDEAKFKKINFSVSIKALDSLLK